MPNDTPQPAAPQKRPPGGQAVNQEARSRVSMAANHQNSVLVSANTVRA